MPKVAEEADVKAMMPATADMLTVRLKFITCGLSAVKAAGPVTNTGVVWAGSQVNVTASARAGAVPLAVTIRPIVVKDIDCSVHESSLDVLASHRSQAASEAPRADA
jgi:hypothetical protein